MNTKLNALISEPASTKLRPFQPSILSSPIGQKTPLTPLRQQNRSSQATRTAPNSLPRATRALNLTYRGSATTTLGQVNPSTGRVINSTIRSSQTAVTASITDPKTAGGIRETNPFSLSISSSSGEISSLREGAFSLFSALPFNFRGGFLVQYWNLRYSGDQLSGQLANTGSQFSLATNLINAREPIAPGQALTPSQINMSRGATITGRVTANSIRVRIQGTGVSLFSRQYAFVIDAVLQR